ncbi:fluoride efflux transporter FluC [Roseomonas elaeocarpi]|uniref:Fluoride-specific ion channel FluC n=1 Tax=Roseomonas elaeocarpi TaxID=907779 RepID=A0ABV6JTJ7_9PROT
MTPFAPQLLALVALGGAIGSIARYAVGILAIRWLGAGFPWGTMAVNVAGSAIIGLLGGAIASGLPMSNEMRLLAITGFLGGFTTFSSFSLDTGTLFLRSPVLAAGYVALTLAGGLLAFALTFEAMRRSYSP